METTSEPTDGVVRLESHYSVKETLDRLEALLKERGITIFTRIDFSADAANAGLAMQPESALVFGNPRAGTPLMIANPAVALDLPLRAICWTERDGTTWLAWNDPAYVIARHGLDGALAGNLAAVTPLLERAARN